MWQLKLDRGILGKTTATMSTLKAIDRIKLERFLEMGDGYVCNFSNKTFGDFVIESVGVDVYTPEYAEDGTSKANRLRSFWRKEPNHLTAKLLDDLLGYWKSEKEHFETFDSSAAALHEECMLVVEKLRRDNPIEDAEAFRPNAPAEDFSALAASIRDSIDKGQPSEALDRLHTFLMRYMRELCRKHSLPFEKDTALQKLFGGYVKFIMEKGVVESHMSERILKSSISVLDAFNSVRNNQSFAHDNPILNHHEAVLIFNNVSNTLRFIESIERKLAESAADRAPEEVDWGDMEFTEEEIEAAGDAWIQSEVDRRRGK